MVADHEIGQEIGAGERATAKNHREGALFYIPCFQEFFLLFLATCATVFGHKTLSQSIPLLPLSLGLSPAKKSATGNGQWPRNWPVQKLTGNQRQASIPHPLFSWVLSHFLATRATVFGHQTLSRSIPLLPLWLGLSLAKKSAPPAPAKKLAGKPPRRGSIPHPLFSGALSRFSGHLRHCLWTPNPEPSPPAS